MNCEHPGKQKGETKCIKSDGNTVIPVKQGFRKISVFRIARFAG